MKFKLWLEENDAPKFVSFNNYGDVVVYINGIKYIYYTHNREIARKAFEAGRYQPWKVIQRFKDMNYEFDKA